MFIPTYLEISNSLQHKSPNWAQTVVEYETDKAGRLPLLDVAVRDGGKQNQMFRIEMGLACFS